MEDKIMKKEKETEKDLEALRKEALELVIKRSKISLNTLYENAKKDFVANNLDLLTKEELKKYKSIIL